MFLLIIDEVAYLGLTKFILSLMVLFKIKVKLLELYHESLTSHSH